MRIKLLLLMLVIGIFGLAATAHAAESLVYNSSFEIDENGDSWPDRWGLWGSNISTWFDDVGSTEEFFMDDPAGAFTGGAYFHGSAEGNDYACAIPQAEDGSRAYIPLEPGDVYYIGIWAKDNMPGGSPSVAPCGLEVGYYNDAGERKSDEEMGRHWVLVEIPADGQYHYIEGHTIQVDPEYPNLNAVAWVENWTGSGEADYNMDDMYLNSAPQSGIIYDPDPPHGARSVPPSTTMLSWKVTQECFDRDIECEVWWGDPADPNSVIRISDPNSGIYAVDLSAIPAELGGPIALEPDQVYYWKVAYEDPNDCNWNAGMTDGPTWSFDTINREPVVDAGLHLDKWMPETGSLEIQLDASYEDDGLPEGGLVTYSWAAVSGVTYVPNSTVEDPQIIIAEPGDYLLTLTVNDGDKDGSDSILIRTFANDDDRLRAHYKLDESAGGTATDSQGGHHGTLMDDPLWQPAGGKVIGAVELDGIDDDTDGFGDHVSIDDTGFLDPNDLAHSWENTALIDGMTVSAWIKLDADGWGKDWETIVGKSTDSWELLRDGDDDNVTFGIKGNVGAAVSGSSVNIPVTDNSWHHVVGVFDRNKVLLYIDALEVGSDDAGAVQMPKSAGKILIGNTNNPSVDPVYDFSFGGMIDEVKIFDAAVPWWAEYPDTPGIVQMYRGDDGGINCAGEYAHGDQNQDCYVTLVDFAMMAADWMACNDVANPDCN